MSFYLLPIVGTGTRQDPIRPKYVRELGVAWSMCQFVETAIVWADTSPAQEATLGANADVRVIPPLDNQVAVLATQQALEDMNMPAQWVTSAMTYRTVLRVTVGMAQLLQRASSIFGAPLSPVGNLDRTIGSFVVGVRQAIAQACDDLGVDRTNITLTTTLREALRDFGQQFVKRGVFLGDL